MVDNLSVQTRITTALPGLPADLGVLETLSRTLADNVKQVDTLTIGTPTIAVAQINTFTIDTAADGDAFTITINGIAVAAGTSAGTDKTVQRDAIEVLLLANAYFVANFAYADSSTDAFTVTALVAGEPFDMTETVESTSAYSFAISTANIVGTQFKLTINGYSFQYAAASTSIETERDALLVLLQADTILDDSVAFDESGTTIITVTALTAGTPFTMTYSNTSPKGAVGVGTVTFTTTTANVTGSPINFGRGIAQGSTARAANLPTATGFVFLGVARHSHKEQDLTTGVNRYVDGDTLPVIRKGRVWVPVEEAVTLTDDVYLRHTANGSDTPGGWRTDSDSSNADQVSNARWATAQSTIGGLAQLEIHMP